ncbi:MAG: M4 family metallopeptidase [Actinomycetota bacterium]|nr:M4 family metallopeptidase [Actinomycetota bacterium]
MTFVVSGHAAPTTAARCTFIPPYLLEQLRRSDDPHATRCATDTLAHDTTLRAARSAGQAVRAAAVVAGAWEIHTAANGTTLPGRRVRGAGEPESGDVAVDEAATGITATLALLKDVFARNSYDDKGAGVLATVHYGTDYDNAFWDGTQLVFGDGDQKIFDRFTKPIDVLAHELAHAMTEKSAGLTYQGQSGALNESISDVVGVCVKQRVLGQTAAAADWLIGEGIFLPGVKGTALRSMKAPGTAYDDPNLGKDPQVGSMDHYVQTTQDNGGVHINSGIPNHAFQLAATAIGGSSAEGAGRIWYAALTSGIGPDTDFAGFAQATVTAAGAHADAVTKAWATVGVRPGAPAGPPAPATSPAAATVHVTRTGGFAGMRVSGSVDLAAEDTRAADARSLVGRIDFGQVAQRPPHPDMYVYEFHAPGHEITVAEHDLTDDLRRLAGIVLES